MVDQSVIATVKQYLAALSVVGIHADRAVLFGSFAQGKADEYSDIDLIVIAPEFDGSRDLALIKTLWRATAADSRIEPIPCGQREWEIDQTRPVLEIARRQGIIIAA
jgi:predicted nucleotidyltransferase